MKRLVVLVLLIAVSAFCEEANLLNRVSNALTAGNYQLMSELVSEDGALINLVPEQKKNHTYTSRQSFYLFKIIFDGRETSNVEIARIKYNKEKNRLQAVLLWEYTIGEDDFSETLFLSAVSFDDKWKLIELTGGR
jgi:hypothetical protein